MTHPTTEGKEPKVQWLYYVTGTFHGSHVYATTEGEARSMFHKHYNGESITHCKKATLKQMILENESI